MMSSWGEMLGPAAYRGLLCYGPSQGSKVTFVRADQWIGAGKRKELDPDEALLAILRRYLAAYGPATNRDFARWFWLEPMEVRKLMESLAPELEEVVFAGHRMWMLTADALSFIGSAQERQPDSLHLLPQYDAYVLGAVPRERLVPEAAKKRILTFGRGRYEGAVGIPILLVNGVIAGIWERRRTSKQTEVRVETFVQLTSPQHKQLEAEAARIGAFLGVEATLSVGTLG
jgi:uncharacterized protein YcaQ